MNQPQKPRVVREVPAEWDEIMRLARQIKQGEIVIKVQDSKVVLTEYTIKRKSDAADDFTVLPL
jgi:hypothetical protein